MPTFIYLGFWQLDRAEEKRETASISASREQRPPLILNDSNLDFQQVEYRKIIAEGIFHFQKQVLIENRKHLGKNGFHILTPLYVEGSDRYLLVNRGWIDGNAALTDPDYSTPEGRLVRISGQATIPLAPALVLGDGTPPLTQHRWPYVTLDAYAAWSGLSLYPFMLLQSPGEPFGFVRSWPGQKTNDAMHLGYAVQWFAFALIAFSIWIKLSLTREVKREAVL